jgi:CRP-like cAMP-binding protein
MSTAAFDRIAASSNMLLAALPEIECERVGKHFQPIVMPLGDVLYEPGMNIRHLYFPVTSVISISYMMADGRADAVARIGPEGCAGVEVFLGSGSTPCRAVVLSAGRGYRIERRWLDEESGRRGALRTVLLRYIQSYLTQVAQTVVCNRHHSIDQQLCRWLLMFLDRQASNNLAITQEQIADLMGVRRESVTEAARKLQITGSIQYQRGHIVVVDPSGLESRSCECYEVVKRETGRLLGMSRRITGQRIGPLSIGSAAGVHHRPPTEQPIMAKGNTSCFIPLPSF